MGRVVVTEFVTLDGVMEDPGGSEGFERGGWAFTFERDPEGDAYKLDELLASDAQLLGRRTYEGFAKAWPSIEDEAGFAEKMNSMPKFVVSSTLRDPEWQNSTVIGADLVDELRLMIFPVVLGAGKRLFADGTDRRPFTVVEAKQVGDCVVQTL